MALVAVNDEGFQLVVVDVTTDRPTAREVYSTQYEMWDCLLSADGSLVAAATTDHNPGVRRFAVTVFEPATGQVVNRLGADGTGSMKAIRFAPVPGDARILVEARRERDGFVEPQIWNARTGEREELRTASQGCDLRPSEQDGDLMPLDWSTDASTLLLAREALATQILLRYDLRTHQTEQLPLPPGSYHRPLLTTSMFGSGECVLAARETADSPQTVLRWAPGTVPEVALSGPAIPPGRPFTSVTFESADGTLVQAWLAVPPGPGPFPAVINVHGGPHWHMVDQFSPAAQAWVDHGYAYLDVNFRGSTGRGARYAEQIWGDVGRLELDDLAAAHAWLRDNGIALPSAIFVSGASYGGYLTLYALGRQPDLWAGGIAQVAVVDWTLTHADCSAALRAAIAGWFGGGPDTRADLYRERSAITHVASVRAPVLIRQGRHDSRAPARQMREYERRMRELGKRIEVHWFDSGHGMPGANDEVAYLERSIAFAEAIRAAT